MIGQIDQPSDWQTGRGIRGTEAKKKPRTCWRLFLVPCLNSIFFFKVGVARAQHTQTVTCVFLFSLLDCARACADYCANLPSERALGSGKVFVWRIWFLLRVERQVLRPLLVFVHMSEHVGAMSGGLEGAEKDGLNVWRRVLMKEQQACSFFCFFPRTWWLCGVTSSVPACWHSVTFCCGDNWCLRYDDQLKRQ